MNQRMTKPRLAPVVFVLYLFLSFSTLFFLSWSSLIQLQVTYGQGTEVNKNSTSYTSVVSPQKKKKKKKEKKNKERVWGQTRQNLQKGICAQRRLRLAWASIRDDQSSLSAWRKPGPPGTHWVRNEDWSDWANALADLSSLGTRHFVGFVMRWLKWHLGCWLTKRPIGQIRMAKLQTNLRSHASGQDFRY